MLSEGDRLPEATVFLGPNEPVTLCDLVEDGPKLLVFYLFDWSSTWTNELELLRDRRAAFDEVGVQPVGISRDSPWTHIAWTQAIDLNFGLLSDWNADAVHAFGIAFEHRGLKDVAQRCTYLVDAGGVIRKAWQYETSEVPDVEEWVVAARELKSSGRSG